MLLTAVFLVFLASPVRAVTDSVWTTHTARSLVASLDADLDEFEPLLVRKHDFQVDRIDDHAYYSVPLLVSVVAVPAVLVGSLLAPDAIDVDLESGSQPYDGVTAAALAALTSLVVFGFAWRSTRRIGVALAAGFLFAFGTQAFSTASRSLWMHTPSMFLLACACYCAVRLCDARRFAYLLGVSLALACFVRPTNAVAVVCFGIWAWWTDRDAGRAATVSGLAVGVAMIGVNLAVFGRPLQPYFSGSRLEVLATTVEALVGNLVSPARGLFVFVPLAALSCWGALRKRRAGTFSGLDAAIGSTIVSYWVVVSCFPHWWGGWSYGPRFLADIAPLIVWFLIPVLDAAVPVAPDGRRLRIRSGVVALLVLVGGVSVVVNGIGAIDPGATAWNRYPVDVDRAPHRLWDWTDPPFLR